MPPAPPPVRLVTLGALSVRREGAGTEVLTGQPALLFAYLVDRNHRCARSELTTLFWPDADPSRGRHGLRQALSRIRKALGSEVLEGSDPVGVAPGTVDWDVGRFEAALERRDLAAALDLCSGPFLDGAADGLSWELAEWVDRRRRELEATLLDVGRGAVRALAAADDFEGALALTDRLGACVPGHRGLIVDTAELLVELGRPHEAGARLAAIDTTDPEPRLAGVLKRVRRTPPEAVAASGERPEPEAPRPAGRGRLAVAAVGAVALAAILIGFFLPRPLDDVSIWFCGQRETRHGFVVRLPEGSVDGVLAEAGCPLLPLGGDSVLVIRGTPEDGARLELHTAGGARVVFEAPWAWPSLPLRGAGVQDGVVSPDRRRVVLNVERPRRAPEVGRGGALETTPPGVAGSVGRPENDWDVVLIDLVDGETRSIGPPWARTFDARFTPDGDAVVYVSDETGGGDLYRYDIATGEVRRLTDAPILERSPVVGRRWTVFAAGLGTAESPEHVRLLDNETLEVRVLHPEPWNQLGADLSPDERHLCWTSKRLGHWEADIVVAEVGGDGPPRSITPAGRDDYCQWLDDDRVLHRSWRTGSEELFLRSRRRWGRSENLTHHGGGVGAPFVVRGVGRRAGASLPAPS